MPSVSEILDAAPAACVLANNDLDRGQLYGRRLDSLLPQKIYATYFVIKKIYDNSGVVAGVTATAVITILDIGANGDEIEIFVDDPDLGSISLGSYTKQSTDIDGTTLATNISNVINGNTYGYSSSSSLEFISIVARPGLGSDINGGNNLSVVVTPARVFDFTFDFTFG